MSYDESLDTAVYVVEATNFEQRFLHERHARNAAYKPTPHPKMPYRQVVWDGKTSGWLPKVGKINIAGEEKPYPVCISIWIAELDSHPVLFWESTSVLVHHGMIKKWLTENVPAFKAGQHCYAENFHSCLNYLADLPFTVGSATTIPVQQPYQQHCWHFSYFHGTLLEQIEGLVGNYPGGPDLVYSPHPTKVLREGRCNITCDLGDGNLVPAVGFFIPIRPVDGGVRGIVVAADDAASIAYGEKLLKDKPRVI